MALTAELARRYEPATPSDGRRLPSRHSTPSAAKEVPGGRASGWSQVDETPRLVGLLRARGGHAGRARPCPRTVGAGGRLARAGGDRGRAHPLLEPQASGTHAASPALDSRATAREPVARAPAADPRAAQ